jgi:trk system potassium uptake protein TrkA
MGAVYVIVVGAGEVGSYVADRLSREGVDVAVVEENAERLRSVADELDVLTVLGSGSHPGVLRDAGATRADLVVAVTNDDETNMITALVAKQCGVPRTIVRIEAPELRHAVSDQLQEAIGADLIIDPDEEAARDIVELLEFPGATEVERFADGEVLIIGATLPAESPLVGRTLISIGVERQEADGDWEFLFGTLSRDGRTIIPRGDQELRAGDQVRALCKRQARHRLMGLLGLARRIPRRVMLLGGGRTAELVAVPLVRRGAEVVIVERDPARARELAEHLHKVTIVEGDFTDTDVLIDAEVGRFDVVVALAGVDDANSLACLFAKAQGATETIAILHRLELLPLLRQAGIDASLSPRTAPANGVLRFVRGGVAGVATFLEEEIEVLEFEVRPGTPIDGAVIAELRLPREILLGAVVRNGEAEIARGRSELHAGDHIVVFASSDNVAEASRVFA